MAQVDRDFAFRLRDVAVNMHESSLTHQQYNISFLNFEKKKKKIYVVKSLDHVLPCLF